MAELKTAQRSRTMVWTAVVLVTAATGYALWAALSGPNLSKYEPLITELAAGTLNDEIFLTRRPDGSFAALFPTYYSKGPIIAGLMYTSRPLTDQDTYMRSMAIGFNRPLIRIGVWKNLAINRRIDEHWYK